MQALNSIIHACFSRIQTLLVFMVAIIVSPQSVVADNTQPVIDLTPYGTLVYISNLNGMDAIMVHSGTREQIVFQCINEAELILTPSINSSERSITFLVDQGASGRTIHSLTLSRTDRGVWMSEDTIVASIPGTAWPVAAGDGSYYVVMPDVRDLKSGRLTGIFRLKDGTISLISSAEDKYQHFWPLISPDARQLLFRQLVVPAGEESPEFWSRMILLNLESDTQQIHFVNEQIYLEQWLSKGILISRKLNDDARTRVYSMYDPTGRTTREIYRSNAWQARVTEDLNSVALIRPEPAANSYFDVFVTDLRTMREVNLTKTPKISESIIGWLP